MASNVDKKMKSYHKLFWGLFLQKRKGEIENTIDLVGENIFIILMCQLFVRWGEMES